jgi:hypothetical protein
VKRVAFVAMGIILLCMACSKQGTKHDDGVYSLNGKILNQNGSAAAELSITLTDSQNMSYIDTTDRTGGYSFTGIFAGTATVNLHTDEYAYLELPRYLDKDTVFNIENDMVLNLSVQEFRVVFHDTGNAAYQWFMYGGVSHDGRQFVFEHDSLEEDYMFSPLIPIPASVDPDNLYVLIRGKSNPAGMSYLILYIYIDDVAQHSYWCTEYDPTWQYHTYPMAQFSQMRGHNLRLCLYFMKHIAPYIYVDDIMIYNY